jgi:hypothetical protein
MSALTRFFSKPKPTQPAATILQPLPPPIVNAVTTFMAPLAPPEDADGSKMNRGEWDAYVAKYGKFPTTPAAPAQPRVIPPEPPAPLPAPFRDEQGFDHGSQAALDAYRVRLARRNANLATEDARASQMRYDGPIPAASLTLDDCKFLSWASSSDTSFATRALSGTQQEVANALQLGAYGGEFDAKGYTGVLRRFLW